jgi:putative peptide zinc metalloprotease protein
VNAGSVMAARVRLRDDVQLSRALLHGAAVVHRVKDPRSGRAFEVGAREHFLMTRLDGLRTPADIGEEYAAAFGRRLAESNWLQLLALLGSRGLLAGHGNDVPTPAAAPAASSRAMRAVEATYRVARRARADGHGARFVPPALLALALATVVFLILHLSELLEGAGWLVRHPPALIAAVGVLWVSAALHELGHGVAALWHGCRVTAVSVAALHCRLDGYAYLRSARSQLAIAGIGGVVNALVLAPLAVTWAVLPADAGLRAWLGGVLLLGLAQSLVNYIPLPPLDGYRMLGHALHTADLAVSSLRFVRAAVGGAARRGPGIAAYPTRARLIYTAYALTALALTAGVLTGALLAARAAAGGRLGTLGVVTAIVAVSMTIAGWLARPARKRAAGATTATDPEGGDR